MVGRVSRRVFHRKVLAKHNGIIKMNNINSYNIISKNVRKVNFLTWAGLRQFKNE